MEYLIGFVIAVFIALTGGGAGTITTPLLVLMLGVPASIAVSVRSEEHTSELQSRP